MVSARVIVITSGWGDRRFLSNMDSSHTVDPTVRGRNGRKHERCSCWGTPLARGLNRRVSRHLVLVQQLVVHETSLGVDFHSRCIYRELVLVDDIVWNLRHKIMGGHGISWKTERVFHLHAGGAIIS